MLAQITILSDNWPFSIAPVPKDSELHGKRFWTHVIYEDKAWNLILELKAEFQKGSPVLAEVYFMHPQAPHQILKPDMNIDLCVGNTIYGKAKIIGEMML